MAKYAPLDTGKYGPGTPMDISDVKHLWKGPGKTNGFLMRSVDGRIPALEESFARAVIAGANPLFVLGVIAWGNGLWRDIANIDTQPGTVHTEKPAKGLLAGVLKFDQGWQTGNPAQNYGLPPYSRGIVIRKGYVGYKSAMAAVGQEVNYAGYLQGDSAQDIPAVRTFYADWTAAYKAGSDGDKLCLFVDDVSGFPIVAPAAKASLAAPMLAGASFAGFAEIFEPENEAIFFSIDL